MNVGDVVRLTDARGDHTGSVVKLADQPGMVTVEWDSGVREHLHESELKQADGAPSQQPVKNTETLHETGPGLPPWEPGLFEKSLAEAVRGETVPMPNLDDDTGYRPDDPKHPSFRERLSALWDSRPGK